MAWIVSCGATLVLRVSTIGSADVGSFGLASGAVVAAGALAGGNAGAGAGTFEGISRTGAGAGTGAGACSIAVPVVAPGAEVVVAGEV